ncbi:AraC family transcriptional regulator [uncultured Oscillibacter sp.]|uniref:helix-turn-helix domain-containing protein n=1 Tax=uncultured Oscillibacter sp. TaxID=876091 RepID=UPI0026285EE1|nr:AraC family transcriptional regulator [uncultured Oscillibacter sp.]
MVHMYPVPASAALSQADCHFRMSYLTNTEIDSSKSLRAIHSHAEIAEIMLVYDGHGVHNIDHREYYSEPGDILLYNTNVIHQDRSKNGKATSHYLCGVAGLQLDGQLPGVIHPDPNCFLLKSHFYFEFLLRGFEMLEHSLQEQSSQIIALSQGFLRMLLAIILELAEKERQGAADSTLKELPIEKRIRHYIDHNFAKDFSLVELANELHISHYYASHVFSKAFGLSPIRYRTMRRIGEAQSLLTSTDESITRIASIVGYDDPNQFSQAFTKVVGMPPSKYRDLSVWPRCIHKKK